MRNKPVTASELLEQLASDPGNQERRRALEAATEELGRVCAADERLLVEEVRAAGYAVDSVWDLVNNSPHPVLERRFIGAYPKAYPVLVTHLRQPHHPRIREGVIRALTVRDGGALVEQALLQEFETEALVNLRWVLANALKYAMPYSRRRKRRDIADAYRAGMGA